MTAHPQYRPARELYRPAPTRHTSRMAAWRDSIRDRVRANAGVLWRGPSRLNGADVLVVATGLLAPSVNVKTGDLVQLYILPADVDPSGSLHNGGDVAVCGDCTHRPGGDGRRDCYVTVAWGPRNLWLGVRSGRVPDVDRSLLEGAAIRFGAWGDPAAVPLHVWLPIVAGAWRHTGYTQRWWELDVAEWGWLMASVDTFEAGREARRAGWRTFRTVYGELRNRGDERECLADAHGVTCLACGGCGGAGPRDSFWIRAHGFRYGRGGIGGVQLGLGLQ